jgi:peptide/nickel transport system substrate-binding protein
VLNDSGLSQIQQELRTGQIGRRAFIRRAAALGLSATAIAGALAACGASATPTAGTTGVASTAPTAAASTGASATPSSGATTATRTAAAATGGGVASPVAGGPTKRGGGGALKILQWQAPTILNVHFSSGTKDDLVCRVVYEPLVTLDGDTNFVPVLAAEIPTKENGGLAADGKSVTYKLKQGVKWSDGQPFTADDVIFTWQYVTDKTTASTNYSNFSTIDKIDKVDDYTVKVSFKDVTPGWYISFGGTDGCIIPKHVFEADKGPNAKNSPNNLKPVGTGPYKVTSFTPGDTVQFVINENYREPNKPYFDQITVKGGGDASSAARAVLQTGDYDYAWNLQVEDNVLKQLEAGGKGTVQFENGGGIERILVNFTDPNKEVDGERSSLKAPHPFQTDPKVRQAYTLLCDRDSVVAAIYGRTGEPTVNVLMDPEQVRSTSVKPVFDAAKANALLDEAGWKKGSDGIRAKDGVKMAITFSTTVNSVRQKTQQIIKDAFEKAGIKTELKSVDSAVFFSSDTGNPDTAAHFYNDLEMYTNYNVLPDPQEYMATFAGGDQIPQKANQWGGNNYTRWSSPDFDKLYTQAKTELDVNKRNQLFIQMNDLVVNNNVHVSLINRKTVFARSKNLQNVNYTLWDVQYWNIANWIKG